MTVTKLKVDTGSQVNIMPFKELREIPGSSSYMDTCSPYMEKCTQKLVSEVQCRCRQELTFHIVEPKQPGLLGLESSQDRGLIEVVMMTKAEEKQTQSSQSERPTKSSIAKGGSSKVRTGIHWIGTLGETILKCDPQQYLS